MTEELSKSLAALADKLGTSVEEVYKVLTKQAQVDAIVSLLQFLMTMVGLIVIYNGWQYLLPYCKDEPATSQYSSPQWPGEIQVMVVLLGVISLVNIVFFAITIADTITHTVSAIINPKGSAIEKILSSL